MRIDSHLEVPPLWTENTPSCSYTEQSGDNCSPMHPGSCGSDERHFQFALAQNPRSCVIDVALRIIVSMKRKKEKKKKIVKEDGLAHFRVDWRQSHSISEK